MMDGWWREMDGWMNEWMEKKREGWMMEREMGGLMDGWIEMGGWLYGWRDRWMDEERGMNGWVGGWREMGG